MNSSGETDECRVGPATFVLLFPVRCAESKDLSVDQPIETLDVETSPLDAGLESSARAKYDLETGHDEPSSPEEMISRVTFNYVMIAITFLLVGIVVGAVGYERVAQTNARLV